MVRQVICVGLSGFAGNASRGISACKGRSVRIEGK